jgi:hypothetical protein
MRQKVGMKKRKEIKKEASQRRMIIKREDRLKRKMGRTTEKTRGKLQGQIIWKIILFWLCMLIPSLRMFLYVFKIFLVGQTRQWMEAVCEEMQALKENDTWILVHPYPGRKILENKWVFPVKRNEEGEVDLHKARLVVKGCAQKKGSDYTDLCTGSKTHNSENTSISDQ